MSAFDETILVAAHQHCGNNRDELAKSTVCGCFECLEIYAPSEITEWVDSNDQTALCARCDIDTVIGDASGYPVTADFLEAMNIRWMQTTIDEDDPRFLELFGAPLTFSERVRGFFDRFRH